MENIIFQEIQQYRQPIIHIIFWIISGIILLFFLILWILQSNNTLLISFFITSAVVIGIYLIIYNTKMITEVQKDKKIAMTFYPFTFIPDIIRLSEVGEIKITNYHPRKDYGGLGIRYSAKGKAYIMQGDNGVLLTFKDSKKKPILIGSQKTEELYSVLQSQMNQ